jgi:hypothetical protein
MQKQNTHCRMIWWTRNNRKKELEHDLVHEEKRHDLVHNEDHKKTRTVARLGERRKIQKKNEMEHDFVHDKKNVILWCSFWMGV